MADEVALDETLKVEAPDLVESALLQRLEEHQADVDAFLQELTAARQSTSKGVLSLQQLLKTAAQLQAKLGLNNEISSAVAQALEKVGIPVQALQEAKALLLALTRLDAAMDAKEAAPEKLKKVLDSWEELRRMEDVCEEEKFQAAFGKIDLDLGQKREQLQSMREKWLMEERADEAETFRESLQKIGLEVKRRETTAPSASPKRSDTSPARCRAAEAAVARSRSPTPPPGMSSITETSPRQRGKAKEQTFEAEVTFSGTGLNSFIESQKQALLKEREAEKVLEEEPSSAPAPSLVTFGKGLPTSAGSTGQAPLARAAPPAPPSGSPELWRAVHVGDEHVLARLIQQGLCNGLQKDASGHSVLWHAIAFGHWGLARMMLERFPPTSKDGVDVNEVHHRKGETFLHLLCQCRPFSSETASIFKVLAEAMPPALFTKVNVAGQSFLAFAAATQNFWVLRHISLRYPEQMKVLICSKEAPLRFLMQKLPVPVPPSFSSAERIPEHVAVSALLSPDASGRVPFADVAFDVSAEDSFSRFLAHRVVVASQSSVLLQELVSAPMQDLPQEGIRGCVFQVDRRISKEVWRNVLQFLYTGVVHCPFAKDPAKMVELLRACALYKLPKPLLDLAQTALFEQLPKTAPQLALEVFSVTCGSSGEGVEVKSLREASMLILLGAASQIFAEMPSEKLSAVMDKVIVLAEQSIFRTAQVT